MRRFPDLPPSGLGWEILSGRIDDFGFEDYLAPPSEREVLPDAKQVQQQFEKKLVLNNLGKLEGVL